VTRVVDRGAITAAWVGVAMAATIGVSFLLVIPIEPFYSLLATPAGLLIGYYANQRSDRRGGPWSRILANALVAGLATALTFALFLLLVKALFFFGDNGYRDRSFGGPLPNCQTGADCVYQRYLADGRGDDLASVGVTDAATFTGFYWTQQVRNAGILFVLTTVGAVGGGVLYALTNRRRPAPSASAAPRAT
jgi:hypothetical protein